MRRFLLPALAALGFVGIVVAAVRGDPPAPVAQPVAPPNVAPYPSYIAASGIIEANTHNIAIATPVAGTIAEVNVTVGTRVKAADPLFRIDGRDLVAQLAVRRAALASAKSKVAEAEASLHDVQIQFELARSISDRRAISAEDLSRRKYAMLLAEAKLRTSRADVANADAQIQETEANIERETIRAPVDGEILQVNIRPGEFAATGVLAKPLVMMGGVDPMHVRIDIDEADAWRFRAGGKARASIRGNREIATDLKFEYVEPYVIPKQSLTGDTTERVDTRVLEVVYSFPRDAMSAYIGQQVDVFIEAPAADATSDKARAVAGKRPG